MPTYDLGPQLDPSQALPRPTPLVGAALVLASVAAEAAEGHRPTPLVGAAHVPLAGCGHQLALKRAVIEVKKTSFAA